MAGEEVAAGRPGGAAGPDAEGLVDLSALATALYGERYEILELLGVGASGSVYRARDVELGDEVALKVLRKELVSDPATLERFRNEVRLARRVTHRNVARVFDIGEHEGERFLSMEFVAGRSLSRRMAEGGAGRALPLSEIVELVSQICAGLQAAHESGVVHCDLKPDNILLSDDGRVVVTDFGIARGLLSAPLPSPSDGAAAGAEGNAGSSGRERGRRPARALQFDGTPMYISPEQMSGERVDARTDLYSLGAVLYELLTGEPPFAGASTVAVLAARVLRPPPDPRAIRPGLPAEVAQVVTRCLAVSPGERPASASELAAALTLAVQRLSSEATRVFVVPSEPLRTSSSPVGPDGDLHVDVATAPLTASASVGPGALRLPSVAVLPLDNLGEPVDADWVSGIARELTDSLASLPGLSVFSQSSVARALSRGGDALAVGQALGAAWVVSGSLRRTGGQVRLVLRLLRVLDGMQVFARRRDGQTGQILALTEELSEELAQVLVPGEGRPAAKPVAVAGPAITVDDYLRARALYERGDMASVRQAVALLSAGLSRAPDEPRLLMSYGLALSRLWFYGDGEAAAQATVAAERLVTLQPRRAESHMSLASTRFQGGELRGALTATLQALAIRPDFAEAHELSGRILIETGPVQRGLEHLAWARRLDPGLLRAVADQARVLALLGRSDRAHELLADRSVIESSFGIQWILRGRLCLWSRDRARAAAYLLDPELRSEQYARARLLLQAAAQHTRIAAQDVLAAGLASDKSSPRGRSFFFQMHAELFAFFGQREQAVRSVARSVDAGLTDLLWLERCPLLLPLAEDPRMLALRQVVYSRAFAVREALSALSSPLPASASAASR